jgi:hypothetical protein
MSLQILVAGSRAASAPEGWRAGPPAGGAGGGGGGGEGGDGTATLDRAPLLRIGTGRAEGFFTLDPEVRKRCQFSAGSVLHLRDGEARWDWVVCRNLQIYFDLKQARDAISHLVRQLKDDGLLCLAHSEAIEPGRFPLVPLGNSLFRKGERAGEQPPIMRARG